MTRMLYVATPIDSGVPGVWTLLRDATRSVLAQTPDVIGFYPNVAFTVGPDTPVHGGIEKANRRVLDECDGLLALLPSGVPTVGVPREIEAAFRAGLPVAVVTDLGRSFSLADVERFEFSVPGVRAALGFLLEQNKPARLERGQFAFHVGEAGIVPTRGHEHDAGYDLYVSHDTTIEPGDFADVQTDVRVALPPHIWGRVVGRSSTRRTRGLLVIEGVIDSGYRGPLYSGVHNLTDEAVTVKRGERLAQLIPHANLAPVMDARTVDWASFDALPHDGRGDCGFGSTGR